MNKEEFKNLKEEEWYNPTLIFSLRTKDQTKKDDRYKFLIFNHVTLHFPYNAEIVEASLNLSAIKQSSADRYMDFNGVKVILPLFIRCDENRYEDENGNIQFKTMHRYDKEMSDEYYNCADFVRKYLVKAGILDTERKRPSVDSLYFELVEKGLVPTAEILNEIHFEDKEVLPEPKLKEEKIEIEEEVKNE